MNERKPEPGSPWHRHCPDAWPREWISEGQLPDGFTRPADPFEADLITGRMTESAFLRQAGKGKTSPPTKARTQRKPNAVVTKIRGWNRFLDALVKREPRFSPLAVALWCWLWRCEKEGRARSSERRLAERFGKARGTIRKALHELEQAGFLNAIRRGKWNRTATIYRVRPAPKRVNF